LQDSTVSIRGHLQRVDGGGTRAGTPRQSVLDVGLKLSYSYFLNMQGILHTVLRQISNIARVTFCVSVALMLVMLPVPRVHQAADHFRSPEIRRSIERNVFLERTKNDFSERISTNYLEPTSLLRTETEDSVKLIVGFAPTPQVPITRLLLRLKLGSSVSGTPDPLL
jgi:hypothetical protein